MARVLVMGAGAVGSYYGACLARRAHDVTFVARGPNLEAIRANGIRVSGAMGEFSIPPMPATGTPSEAGQAELVLLCVKNYDLEAAAEAIRGIGSCVLTLQNGVEAAGRARDILGDVVLAGTTGIVCDLPEPGHVHLTSAYAWIRFGEPDGGGVTERVRSVARVLDADGIEPIPVDDARISLWEKMALMCGMAGLTTLLQRPMGEILGDAELRARFKAIVVECERVARACGVPLPDAFVDGRMRYADNIDRAAMSSMSRDFARGKRIELDTFNGAIVRMGAELGIDVPENADVYEGIRAAVR
ncbi:MAG TPA: 2-dehydropantoate 2-reductase [Actinomycetota bacterium]|jgi:2-dehydropantoate 2-reductase|nr:2-dehydropantoate 2-reductase [Actinomycetota bacterium]